MATVVTNQLLREVLLQTGAASDELPDTGLPVEADSVRALLRELDSWYPGSAGRLRHHTAVAIDGEIHADAELVALAPDSEVCFIPAIEGG